MRHARSSPPVLLSRIVAGPTGNHFLKWKMMVDSHTSAGHFHDWKVTFPGRGVLMELVLLMSAVVASRIHQLPGEDAGAALCAADTSQPDHPMGSCRSAFLLVVRADCAAAVASFAGSLPDARCVALTDGAGDGPAPGDQLSARLGQVLSMVGTGMSNKSIGRRLGISHFTVRNHVSRLLQIYGVSNREDLVLVSRAASSAPAEGGSA